MAASFAALLAHAPSHVPPPESLHRHEHSHDGEHHCIHEKLTPATAHGIAPQSYGDATEKALSGGGAGGARLPLRIVINDDSLFADEHACLEAGGRRRDAFDPNSWQACEPADVLTAEKRTLLVERMMPRATAFFSRLLKVRRVDGRLRLSGTVCGYEGGVRVPEAYRTAGVADADIVVFLTARPIGSYGAAGDTIAYAGHCEADQHGRPISAHFNWSPRTLSPPSDEWLEGYLLRVALHELTHALAFSPALLRGKLAADDAPATGGGFAGALGGALGGGGGLLVVSPHVARAARAHFGCERLRGARLEDGGGVGTGGAHWEMRWFRDEYMTGAASPGERVVSSLTLALFADAGWYDVNASMGEVLPWGRGAGCGFVEGSCGAWNSSELPRYRCDDDGDESCSYDRKAKAYCALTRYGGDLPAARRYFETSPRLGGYSALLDYCPVYRPYSNGHCAQPAASSYWAETRGEEFCPHCRCVDSTLGRGAAAAAARAGCHRTRCLNATALELRLGGRWRSCPPEGGVIDALPSDNFRGALHCPPAAELCALSGANWPTLTAVEPSAGPAAGGTPITLRGANLGELQLPVAVAFGVGSTSELAATDVAVVDGPEGAYVTATLPPYLWATSFSRADVSITDGLGRSAVLFAAFEYSPGWRPYAATAVALLAFVVLATRTLPAFIRAGCEAPTEVSDDPKAMV